MNRYSDGGLNGGEVTFGSCEVLTACSKCGGEVYQYSGEESRLCDLCEVRRTIEVEQRNVDLLLYSLATVGKERR